jgi:hypothetical protein
MKNEKNTTTTIIIVTLKSNTIDGNTSCSFLNSADPFVPSFSLYKYKSLSLTPQAQKERMREGGGRRGTSKLREVARKVVVVAAAYACGSFSRRKTLVDPVTIDTSCSLSATVCTILLSKCIFYFLGFQHFG